MTGVLSSLRYLFADIIGDDEEDPPHCPTDYPLPPRWLSTRRSRV